METVVYKMENSYLQCVHQSCTILKVKNMVYSELGRLPMRIIRKLVEIVD